VGCNYRNCCYDALHEKARYSINEFFLEHPDGSRNDVELHEPILSESEAESNKIARDRLNAKGVQISVRDG
jgi:hypothetical protein